jgi:hypothetical protein
MPTIGVAGCPALRRYNGHAERNVDPGCPIRRGVRRPEPAGRTRNEYTIETVVQTAPFSGFALAPTAAGVLSDVLRAM